MNLDRRADPIPLKAATPRWPYVAVLAAYALALAVLGSDLPAHFGFPLDDSWIHQTVGRNFALFHSLGYLPHVRSSGSTSLLWTLILSANYTLLPHLSTVLYTLAVNSLALAAIGLLLLRLALRDALHPALAVLWAAAPAADGNFVWLAFTGMEHLLFIALSLAAIALWLQPERRTLIALQGAAAVSNRSAGLAGLAMGLLAMTRPEGIALPVLLLLATGLVHRTRRDALTAAAVALPFAVAPFAVNLVTSHALLPVTFKGRQWMYFAAGGSPSVYRLQLLEQWVIRPAKAVLALEGATLPRAGRLAVDAVALTIMALAVVAIASLLRGRRYKTLAVCAWAGVHSLLYVLILPVSGHGGRYQPFLLLLVLPLVALGLQAVLARTLTSGAARAALPLTATLLLIAAAVSLPLWRNVLGAGIDHIRDSHGAMAAYLDAQHLTEPLAVFDIGRIGYDRGGNLTDLGGLTDSAYIAFLYGDRVPQYLAEHHIALVVLPTHDNGQSTIGEELHLTLNPNVTLTPIHRACTPYETWRLGWIETRHADQCQELFRFHAASR
jgi:hypothetical protein